MLKKKKRQQIQQAKITELQSMISETRQQLEKLQLARKQENKNVRNRKTLRMTLAVLLTQLRIAYLVQQEALASKEKHENK